MPRYSKMTKENQLKYDALERRATASKQNWVRGSLLIGMPFHVYKWNQARDTRNQLQTQAKKEFGSKATVGKGKTLTIKSNSLRARELEIGANEANRNRIMYRNSGLFGLPYAIYARQKAVGQFNQFKTIYVTGSQG